MEFFAKIKNGFDRLVGWKEKTLISFFSWPWVAPLFRYLTPNELCYIRIVAAIAIIVLYQYGRGAVWLAPLFIFASLLDLIDGPLARATNQVSEEGKKLDPIADKVLIILPLLVIGFDRLDGQTISMLLLVEGFLFLTAYLLKPYLRERFSIPLTSGANIFGQIKMTFQTFAVGFLLIDPYSEILLGLSRMLIWVSIGFGILSFLRHLARLDYPVEPRKRIITLPNLITLSGIFLIVPAGFALYRQQWLLAGLLIGWMFFSDWLDGWVAERFKQATAFGAAIDPLRDYLAKFMVFIWLYFYLDLARIQIAVAAIVITEATAGLVNLATARRCKTVRLVTRWGKIRSSAHYGLSGVIFFHCVGWYSLSLDFLLGIFAVMFIFSLLSLIS